MEAIRDTAMGVMTLPEDVRRYLTKANRGELEVRVRGVGVAAAMAAMLVVSSFAHPTTGPLRRSSGALARSTDPLLPSSDRSAPASDRPILSSKPLAPTSDPLPTSRKALPRATGAVHPIGRRPHPEVRSTSPLRASRWTRGQVRSCPWDNRFAPWSDPLMTWVWSAYPDG